MRTFIILALLCSSLYAAVASATNDTLVTLGETNGFGVQFALTEDESLFANWDKPAPPHYTPIFIARRGVPIFTVVVFAGVGLQKDGSANVTFDAVIHKPDGSIYGRQTDMVGVQGRIDPSPKTLQLCRDYMGIRIEPKDPAGTYTVEVFVKDNIKKLELHLKRTFIVEK
ncbi:MAG TPA: hypothetical protein VIK59_03330 [Verrucomicrobiae bacterium]